LYLKPVSSHSLVVMVFNPDFSVMEEHGYGVLAAQKTVLNRDTDDSENVTGNETVLMRAIIGMFMK
jgi:hypothetical protein